MVKERREAEGEKQEKQEKQEKRVDEERQEVPFWKERRKYTTQLLRKVEDEDEAIPSESSI